MCASNVKRIHGAEANSLSFLKGYIEKRFRRINPDLTTFKEGIVVLKFQRHAKSCGFWQQFELKENATNKRAVRIG